MQHRFTEELQGTWVKGLHLIPTFAKLPNSPSPEPKVKEQCTQVTSCCTCTIDIEYQHKLIVKELYQFHWGINT